MQCGKPAVVGTVGVCVKRYSINIQWHLYHAGRGGKEGAVQKCGLCRGTGMQIRIHQLGPGMVQQIQTVCAECRGEGECIDPKLRCKVCNGQKIVKERKILEVHIDKGKHTFLISYFSHLICHFTARLHTSRLCKGSAF